MLIELIEVFPQDSGVGWCLFVTFFDGSREERVIYDATILAAEVARSTTKLILKRES
jgi:hypothetical protein